MADLLKRVPDILKDLYEFRELMEAENPEFDFLDDLMLKWRENLFPKAADKDGIRRFEEMLEITPEPGDTLQRRRDRVVAKLNSRLPYTEIQLRKILASICGWDDYELQIRGLELFLWISMKNADKAETLYRLLLEIVPENMWFALIQTMQFLAKRLAAAQKQKTWLSVLPWQEREITDNPDVWIAGAQWQRDPVAILPWQPHHMDFGPQLIPSAQRQKHTVTLFPPQVKGADSAVKIALRSWTTARQVISVRAGQDPHWRYIYE